MNAQQLIDFETEIAELFTAQKIGSPVHLAHGNEEQLLEIFAQIKPDDWVFSTWRCHYHALLKGVPANTLRDAILANRSMTFCSGQHRFVTSAIVGGTCAPAVGVALGIKRQGLANRVWCFIGDMAAETGEFHTAHKYAVGHDLPITFVIEDNGKSVLTPTQEVWGFAPTEAATEVVATGPHMLRYHFKSKYPHVGIGRRVFF